MAFNKKKKSYDKDDVELPLKGNGEMKPQRDFSKAKKDIQEHSKFDKFKKGK